MVTMRAAISKIVAQEDLNFLLTNRLPRRLVTRFMGWFSKIEQPVVRTASIATWRFFSDVDLSDAEKRKFRSMHDCFTRALVPGARVAVPEPEILASPCDAIVGACGRIDGDRVYQVKGFGYSLSDLAGHHANTDEFRDGSFVTLRLTAGMYHRFHAPHDMEVDEVTYISGDTWNVNPIALKRIEKLFCKNERALIHARLTDTNLRILMAPVAAILVASIRLHFLDTAQALRIGGPRTIACNAEVLKGEEMGWFEHGSTIILFVPKGVSLMPGIEEGVRIKAGQALMQLPERSVATA